MTRLVRLLVCVFFAVALAACGGGGGSAGTTTTASGGTSGGGSSGTSTGGGSGSGAQTAVPTLTISLVDASGATVAGNVVSSGAAVFAKATLKDASGVAVKDKMVAFSSSGGVLVFQPTTGQVLTDSNGVAKVQVTPKSLNAGGADTLKVSGTVGETALNASIDVQTSPAQVTLSNFAANLTALSAFQSTTVNVDVGVNGSPATTTPVTVSFSSNCGSFTPTSVTSNSLGKAVTTFQSNGCAGGTATLTASAQGASPVQASVSVQAPSPTNIQFVSATPLTIYTSAAAFGAKQSTLVFKVVDASGSAVTSSPVVRVSLSNSAIASGVVFSDTISTAEKLVSADASGLVTVSVKSGGIPTPLAVTAQLQSNSAIVASSAGLAVSSGQPVQKFFSLSASAYSIEGWDHDNVSTDIMILLADRLGQPVPAGTPISFITEGGQITPNCTVFIDSNNKSGCKVSLVSQDFRPDMGRVTILAYTEGEEAFDDLNGNNLYDAGEPFYDMGQPFLDSNMNNAYDSGEQRIGDPSIPGAGIGTQACPSHRYQTANIANTCDGVWGLTRVRAQAQIIFATSKAFEPAPITSLSDTGFSVLLSDLQNNSMPADTTVTASIAGGKGCSVVEVVPAAVSKTDIYPTQHRIAITKGDGDSDTCSGAKVTVKATTPMGTQTLLGVVTIP
jgi:hypothetical protein